jgi:CheY-like chemotaxis protein
LAITDLSLPALNGEELIERMRADPPRTPRYHHQWVIPTGLGPVLAFLQKPFLPKMLAERSRTALKGSG